MNRRRLFGMLAAAPLAAIAAWKGKRKPRAGFQVHFDRNVPTGRIYFLSSSMKLWDDYPGYGTTIVNLQAPEGY